MSNQRPAWPGVETVKSWEIKTSVLGTAREDELGRDGWEPFAAYYLPAPQPSPIVVWRKQVDVEVEEFS